MSRLERIVVAPTIATAIILANGRIILGGASWADVGISIIGFLALAWAAETK